MMFGFVAKHRGIWPVAFLCEALGVSRSGFYAWLTRGPSARSRREEVLSAKIRVELCGQRSHLRRAAGVARPAGCRDRVRAARDRASDASERAESASATTAFADRFGRPSGGGALGERARPPLRGTGAQPQMGGRLHLRLDGRGLAVRGSRARPVLAHEWSAGR